MTIFGSQVNQRSFLEEVKVTTEFLNPRTLESGRAGIAMMVARIGVFLLVAAVSGLLTMMLVLKALYDTPEDPKADSVRILAFSYIVIWMVIIYVHLDFTCSMMKLRQVVKIVTKVDLFLKKTTLTKKRLSYFRTAMTVKYVVLLVLSLTLIPRLLGRYNMPLFVVTLFLAAILISSFLGDIFIRKFTIMVHFIGCRLKLLEDLLEKTWIGRGKGWQQDVKTLIQAQDLLCDACAVLNSAWKRMLVALVATIFVSLVRCSVTLSVSIMKKGFDLWGTYELSFLLIYWLWNLYDITHYTQQCESQVQDFNSTLYCFAMSSSQMRTAEPDFVDTLMVQLGRKRKVVFSAHGLFPINHTLVHSVLAGVFTTVIIILQTDM